MNLTDLQTEARTPGFPVSVKGVLLKEGQAVLLKNEREEWELPGGKLEEGETPEDCLAREVSEELSLRVEVGQILDAWVYRIKFAGDVLVVTYGCTAEDFSTLEHGAEHAAVGFFGRDELDAIAIPDGYKKAIRVWSGDTGGGRP